MLMAKDTLVERVRALTPQIAAIARNTELARKPDDGIMALLAETGFFRALTPKRWGGLEIDLADQREAVELVSEACMSTGWVAAFYTGHNLFVSRFSEQAQADVYASGPDCRVPATIGSLMNVKPVAGGVGNLRPCDLGHGHHARRLGHRRRADGRGGALLCSAWH